MPMARSARVQAIHVDDLAAVLVRLALAPGPVPARLAAVGPRATTMAGYLAALREGLAAAPALVLELPKPAARALARVAAWHPSSALTPASLTMLEQSADGGNTADAGPVAAILGRSLRDPAEFARPAQRAGAALAWGEPLLRLAMALLWLWTAYVSWFGWPHGDSLAWPGDCGVPPGWHTPVLAGACLADAAIGSLLLLRPRRWLWPLQIVLVLAYTAVLSWCLPRFWLHPFGPLAKNLPLLAMLAVLWRLGGKAA